MIAWVKGHAWMLVALVALAWLFFTLTSKRKLERVVAQAPGKAPPSASPAAISPTASGSGSKEQPFSPARAVTALDATPQDGLVASLLDGASIAGQTIAKKLGGEMIS